MDENMEVNEHNILMKREATVLEISPSPSWD